MKTRSVDEAIFFHREERPHGTRTREHEEGDKTGRATEHNHGKPLPYAVTEGITLPALPNRETRTLEANRIEDGPHGVLTGTRNFGRDDDGVHAPSKIPPRHAEAAGAASRQPTQKSQDNQVETEGR